MAIYVYPAAPNGTVTMAAPPGVDTYIDRNGAQVRPGPGGLVQVPTNQVADYFRAGFAIVLDDPAGVPAGGYAGQVLGKAGNGDYDLTWMEAQVDPLAQYKISDMDMVGDPNYFGYEAIGGSWYIMQYLVGADSFRYVKGPNGYVDAWATRVNLIYDLFSNVFL